jgi:hypothetical protein
LVENHRAMFLTKYLSSKYWVLRRFLKITFLNSILASVTQICNGLEPFETRAVTGDSEARLINGKF